MLVWPLEPFLRRAVGAIGLRLSRPRTVRCPSGFIEPCQPSKVDRPPSGPLWVHEIKPDGYRLMVRRYGFETQPRCYTKLHMEHGRRT